LIDQLSRAIVTIISPVVVVKVHFGVVLEAKVLAHSFFFLIIARSHQCAPMSSTPLSVAAPYQCWQLLSHFKCINCWVYPGLAPFRPQNCPGIWTPSNMSFLGPTQVHLPNDILIGSAVFEGLVVVTNRQTDHTSYTTPSVAIGCI